MQSCFLGSNCLSCQTFRSVESDTRGWFPNGEFHAYILGEYGLKDVCLSLPCIVSENGVERIVKSELTDEELAGLRTSAQVLQTTLAELDDRRSE